MNLTSMLPLTKARTVSIKLEKKNEDKKEKKNYLRHKADRDSVIFR